MQTVQRQHRREVLAVGDTRGVSNARLPQVGPIGGGGDDGAVDARHPPVVGGQRGRYEHPARDRDHEGDDLRGRARHAACCSRPRTPARAPDPAAPRPPRTSPRGSASATPAPPRPTSPLPFCLPPLRPADPALGGANQPRDAPSGAEGPRGTLFRVAAEILASQLAWCLRSGKTQA